MNLMLMAMLVLAQAPAADDLGPVKNGGFEEGLTAWTVDVESDEFGHVAAVDLAQHHGGKASLKLSSPMRKFVNKTVTQRIEARPDARYKMVAWCRTEQAVRDIDQNQQAYVSLVFLDRFDRVIAEKKGRPRIPQSDWHTVGASGKAPARCRAVEIRLHCSLSGTMWVDDVACLVTGGRRLQRTEVLLTEDFTGSEDLPPGWSTMIGATRGGGKVSNVAIDLEVGAPSNYNSLRLSGDAGCGQWLLAGTEIAVQPGDRLVLEAVVKAEEIRHEADQYRNHHVNFTFFDAGGRQLSLFTGDCGFGTYNWKAVDLTAVAPPGSAKARVGYFLSNSGTGWIDRIRVRRTGNVGNVEGWPEVATEHLDVKYSPDHPGASGMKRYAASLEETYRRIRKWLDVKYSRRITVMLYRDAPQGMELTGRRLNFSEPKDRIVHLRPNATRGHEMVHVISQAIGRAGTELFGEGLAVWFDTQPFTFHHSRAAALLEQGRLPTLDLLLGDFRSDEKVTYRAAGSFVGYLIATHGLEALKRVYVLRNPRLQAKPHLGVHLDVAYGAWKRFLAEGKF